MNTRNKSSFHPPLPQEILKKFPLAQKCNTNVSSKINIMQKGGKN